MYSYINTQPRPTENHDLRSDIEGAGDLLLVIDIDSRKGDSLRTRELRR